jgi:hypothetical protein
MATKGAGASLPKTTSSHELAVPTLPLLGSGKLDDLTKQGIVAANSAGQASFRQLLQDAVEVLCSSAPGSKTAGSALPSGFLSKESYELANAAVTKAITNAVRLKADQPAVVASLVAAGLQEALAQDVATVVSKRVDSLREAMAATVPHHPKLESLRT